jgi:hypothetical protein
MRRSVFSQAAISLEAACRAAASCVTSPPDPLPGSSLLSAPLCRAMKLARVAARSAWGFLRRPTRMCAVASTQRLPVLSPLADRPSRCKAKLRSSSAFRPGRSCSRCTPSESMNSASR